MNQLIGSRSVNAYVVPLMRLNDLKRVYKLPIWIITGRIPNLGACIRAAVHRARVGAMHGQNLVVNLDICQKPFIPPEKNAFS